MALAIEAGALVTPQVRLVRPLASGGMGTVWVAHHHGLATDVAVKLIAGGLEGTLARRRFEREATLMARVRSPHVVSVLDAGMSEVVGPYVIMELLVGRDLAAELERRGPLDLASVVSIVEQTCAGLQQAHDAGLVHRDLKLGNLFLCEDLGARPHVKILDFGIALAEGEESRLTGLGQIVGTRSTMSPEQAAGSPLDARSDLYSLALVVFRLLTGQSAISRASLEAFGLAAYRAELPRISGLAAVPVALDAWFATATEVDPARRFPSALALAQAFRAAAESAPPPPRRVATDAATAPDELALTDGPLAREPASVTTGETAPDPGVVVRPGAPPAERSAPGQRRYGRWIGAILLTFGALGAGLLAARPGGSRVAESAPETSTTASDAAGLASAEVHISLLMDTSGENRRRGQDLERAARTAVTLVNAAGGARGQKLVLHTIDDEGATGPFLLARAADALRVASVPVLMGPMLSAQATATRDLVRQRGALELSATATAASLGAPLGEAGSAGGFIGLSPSDEDEAEALAALARGASPEAPTAGRRCGRLAIIATRDAHGAPFAQALQGALARPPRVQCATTEVEPEPRRDYDAVIGAALATGADCLALLVSPKIGGRLLAAIPRAPRTRVRVLAGDSLASVDFVEFARGDVEDTQAPSLAEGVEGVAVASAGPKRPEYVAFRRHFREVNGREAEEPFAAHQFDATLLLALALEAEGTRASAATYREAIVRLSQGKSGYGPSETERLLRAIARGEDVRYEGASGDLRLDPGSGRVRGVFEAWVIRGGTIRRGPARAPRP